MDWLVGLVMIAIIYGLVRVARQIVEDAHGAAPPDDDPRADPGPAPGDPDDEPR